MSPTQPAPEGLSLTLYTRDGCVLCDHLLEALAQYCAAHQLLVQVQEVDITEDPRLLVRYARDIPVLMLGGREVCRHQFDARALAREIEANGSARAR